MKRQSQILAGSAIALLMASAPLSALPLDRVASPVTETTGSLPLLRAQTDCPEGETCAPAAEEASPDAAQPEEKPRKKRRGEEQQENAAPAEQVAPAEQAAPAEQPPAEQAAPAEPEQKPRRKRQSEEQQDNAAPAQEAAPAEQAPAEQAAPAEPEQKPRKKRKSQEQQDNAAPAQESAPAEQAPAEAAPSGTEQPADQGAETGSKKDKLRNYLKKKQNGEEAPAEQAKPAEEAAPTPQEKPAEAQPEQKPAEAAQPPAQGEQPTDQGAETGSKKDKLRDYLKKKKQGGSEAAPAEEQPAENAKPAEEGQPADQAQPEQPATDHKTGGEAKPAAEPELPTNTREQAMPEGKAEARPQPENAAPLPDSAKGAGSAEGQAGANGKPSGEVPQAGQEQAEQPATGQAEGKPEAVPDSDSAAQTRIGKIDRIESVEAVEGKRVDRDQWQQQWRKRREEQRSRNDGQVVKEVNNRIIIKEGDNIYVDNRDVNVRLERNARDSYVEELPDDFSRYTIVKNDGTRVVTIRNSYGDIVRRSRITRDDREVVLYYVPESDYDRLRGGYYDAGADLPPLRLDIPADQYILDAQYAEPDDYYTYLDAPPVEPVERIYSIDEVVHSARIRDKVRRVDLDTITFDTGSAEIGEDQVNHLQALGDAINKILKQNPAETFLIEGHTDAVGSDESNLVLSDERAQAVAEALTSVFDIPAENLTPQGYGERYLKVNTEGAERENRRVAIRRITPLVAPVASAK